MTEPIEEAELRMLAYLSEHAGGYHQRLWLDPKPLIRALGLSQEQFGTDSARLVAHGLAGVRNYAPDAVPVPPTRCCAIWLTGKGEDYMRALQAALGAGPKLNAGAVKELWAQGTGAIVRIAGELLVEFADHPGHPTAASRLAAAAAVSVG